MASQTGRADTTSGHRLLRRKPAFPIRLQHVDQQHRPSLTCHPVILPTSALYRPLVSTIFLLERSITCTAQAKKPPPKGKEKSLCSHGDAILTTGMTVERTRVCQVMLSELELIVSRSASRDTRYEPPHHADPPHSANPRIARDYDGLVETDGPACGPLDLHRVPVVPRGGILWTGWAGLRTRLFDR